VETSDVPVEIEQEGDNISAAATPLVKEDKQVAKNVQDVASIEQNQFGSTQMTETMVAQENSTDRVLPADANKWRQWWIIPLWVGVAITVSGGFLMYWAQQSAGIGLWFLCAGVPFLTGVAVMALAWASRSAPWLHLRVQQKPGEHPQRIAFSFPLPIRPTAWFLRNFGGRIPQLKDTSLDEVLLAVGESTSPESPIYIQVDEGDEGEKVEIFIG
jgi:hypothetical protein